MILQNVIFSWNFFLLCDCQVGATIYVKMNNLVSVCEGAVRQFINKSDEPLSCLLSTIRREVAMKTSNNNRVAVKNIDFLGSIVLYFCEQTEWVTIQGVQLTCKREQFKSNSRTSGKVLV